MWGVDPLLGSTPVAVETPATPKILLVDDDPIFCKAVQNKAKKLNLDLTVCKTMGDVTTLASRPNFDVAILDYFFGSEMTAFQLSHMFDGEIPVVLISNTEGRKLSGDSWPPEIRTFVHKSAGIDAILAQAFLAARWGHLVPRISENVLVPDPVADTPWFQIMVALVAAGGLALLLYFSRPSEDKTQWWFWDKNTVHPTDYVSEYRFQSEQGVLCGF